MNSRFVSYLRVSTDKQGRSGLGLEAQREAVRAYVAKAGGALVEEVVEVESGRKAKRPQLARALALCKLTGAVLIVAKLDRLARNAGFLLSVHDGGSSALCVDCDGLALRAGLSGPDAHRTSHEQTVPHAGLPRRGNHP